MAWTLVQTNIATTTSAASLPCTFSSSVTAGNFVVVECGVEYSGATGAPSTLADNKGNTYTKASDAIVGTSFMGAIEIWSAPVVTGGSSFTVTWTPTNTGAIFLRVTEYSVPGAIFSLETQNSGTGTGSTLSAGPITTANTDLVTCVGLGFGGGFYSWTLGAGWTLGIAEPGTGSNVAIQVQYQLNRAPGTETPGMSNNQSGSWACATAAFTATLSTYALSASAGSFSLTGKSATLLHARDLPAATGTFALTGEAASLTENVATLAAAPGAFALTGEPASLLHAHTVPATHGSFALTGEPAGLGWGLTLTAGLGTFALTGHTAGLDWGHDLAAGAGSFALTGQAATLGPSNIVEAATGVFTVGRISASLLWAHQLFAAPGAFTLTGLPAVLEQPFMAVESAGSFSLTGQAAGLWQEYEFGAAAGVFALNGDAVVMLPSAAGPIIYSVYSNTGVGDPINYSVAIDVTQGLTYTTAPLARPGIWSFGVRAQTNFGQESNLECACTIVLNAAGVDISDLPGPPAGLRCFATAGGTIRVEWTYSPPSNPAKKPTGFHVYQAPGSAPNYATPAATVPYAASIYGSWGITLGPLTNGLTYAIGVRAYNADAEEANTVAVSAVAESVGPLAVVGLTAQATV